MLKQAKKPTNVNASFGVQLHAFNHDSTPKILTRTVFEKGFQTAILDAKVRSKYRAIMVALQAVDDSDN
ncbi:uncharacterized protein ASCRUDRAFT_6468 [Ascoidea rubescens DSM 1968]|uniref:Uncharacterized protein n=1 Tax=Ascoidea rubescens DSM 1968 TaxID=1344418 RepID=A0A1D2VMP6_9ASCO|nr:hypothetical protein ASCRUDRAFT_6468 [Ascoidea rubescens DSM 1968]ODV62825.1 hypothetical protein ASCRUDRAFT_6468 [Ascoidea rubescens DSM 1968]